METTLGTLFTVVGSIAAALLFLLALHRLWAPSRRAQNDVVGPSVGVIGTMYAVLVAFMLSGVWQNFQEARVNAEQESNALVDLYRFAEGLPGETRAHVQALAREYAKRMLNEEWPAMHRDIAPEQSGATHDLWAALVAQQPRNQTESLVLDHALTELNSMSEHRRIRLLQSKTQLPPILWTVLVVGGIVTVASSCLFGAENLRAHMIQVFAISFLVSLMLTAIAQVDRPYQGDVHVEPDGFRFALDSFDHWPQAPK